MFRILLQTARGMLNSVICTAHFSDNFNTVFYKKIERLLYFYSIACKKRTD